MAVTGVDDLLKDFDKILKESMQAVQAVTVASAATLEAEMKTNILARQKTGIKWPSLPNRSSAAGESPATQSGKLARSIKAVLSADKTEAFVGIHNTAQVPYAVWLEYGTRGIEPRPFVWPALQKHKNKIIEDYKKALKI